MVRSVSLTASLKVHQGPLLSELVAAMFMSLLAIGLNYLDHEMNIDNILIGALTLVPIGLTNALRDLFMGDLLSGIVRMLNSAECLNAWCRFSAEVCGA